MVMTWNHIWQHRWQHITKKLLSLFKREHTKLEDIPVTKIDTRMKSILSQYIQAKRDHEYMINQKKAKRTIIPKMT